MSLTLGALSAKFIDQVNAVHNNFAAVPPPNQMVSRQTQIDQTLPHNFTGVVNFAIVDANNQLVQKATIDFDAGGFASMAAVTAAVNASLGAAGALTMGGGVLSFSATNSAHGVVIADDTVNPSQRGGQGFSQFFGLNDLLEASVRGNYDTGLTGGFIHDTIPGGLTTFEARDVNGRVLKQYVLDPTAAGATYDDILAGLNATGALGSYFTFSLDANGAMDIAVNPGAGDVRLAVTADTTSMSGTAISFSALFGIGDKYRVNPSKEMKVLDSISQQPARMAMASFDLTAAVGMVALSQGDQTGALALQALETAVTQFDPAGELSTMSALMGQYAAAFYSSAGLKAARAEAGAEDQGALLAEINIRIADVSGVNLDEELANMIVLQNSFNAAARLITTSEEMFDALLAAV